MDLLPDLFEVQYIVVLDKPTNSLTLASKTKLVVSERTLVSCLREFVVKRC